MFRDFIRRLNKTFFWISKWIVAAAVLALVLLVGVVFLVRRDIDFDTFLNYFALGLLIFVVITLFYGIIAIHDVPYEIAKARDHPQQDAIHVAGWVSLFTLHVLWPFLWIWAMLYRPDRGWGFQQATGVKLEELLRRVEALEARSGDAVLRRQIPITEQPPALKIVDPQ
jgi:Protein of unknown function (DUF3302)